MTTIKQRRGTAAQWTSANPVLAVGEPGHETDTHKKKTGDGTTAWNSLAYDFSATYLPFVGEVAAWQPLHTYAPGERFISPSGQVPVDNSLRLFYVSTGYTSGAAFGATDLANAFALIVNPNTSIQPYWFEPADGPQGRRIATNLPLWVTPDASLETDALYARAGVNDRSSFELEGALAGPGTARVHGIVIWDNADGTLVYFVGPAGDINLGGQRHLISGAGSGTAAPTVPVTAVPGANAGAGAPAVGLADCTDIRGTVFFGTGTGATAGKQVKVSFARAFATPPHVVVSPANGNALLGVYVDWANDVTATDFTISFATAPASSAGGGTYAVTYHVIG